MNFPDLMAGAMLKAIVEIPVPSRRRLPRIPLNTKDKSNASRRPVDLLLHHIMVKYAPLAIQCR